MVFHILTYKSVTNTDIGKLQRLIKTSLSLIIDRVRLRKSEIFSVHRIHYDFHLRFPNVLRICLRSMFAGFDKFISMNSGCEGILLL